MRRRCGTRCTQWAGRSGSAPSASRRLRATRCSRAPTPRSSPRLTGSGAALATLTTSQRRAEARAAERILVELLGLERELLELSYVRRADALERAREAVRRVG